MRIDRLDFVRADKRLSLRASDALFSGATLDEDGLMHGDRAYVHSLLDEVSRACGLAEGALTVVGEGSVDAPTYRLSGIDAHGAPRTVSLDVLDDESRARAQKALEDVLETTYALLVMP